MLKYIKSTVTELKEVKFNQVDTSTDVEFAISEFERKVRHFLHFTNCFLLNFKKELGRRYKFGVLYVKDGQKDESEIYSNTEYSKDFEEFLEFIGTRVELKGFEGFSGGLDTKRKLNEVSRKILTLS